MQMLDLTANDWFFSEANKARRLPATVPGCVHTDLLANKAIPDPFFGTNELQLQWIGERQWQYSTAFTLTKAQLSEQFLELVCEGLDTLATVRLNGKVILKSDNMFIAHRVDVRAAAKAGKNALTITFDSAEAYIRKARPEHTPRDINDPVGRCTTIRKEQCQFGWDWGPRFVTAGVWKPIRIEAWSINRIEHTHITQAHRLPAVDVTIKAATALRSKAYRLRADIAIDGKTIATKEGVAGETALTLPVEKARLWWPAGQGEQPLYTVCIQLIDTKTNAVLDEKTQRIGLRTVQLEREADTWGECFRFSVNGRKIFAKGANWIPANAFVAGLRRNDYARDLTAAVQANMNIIRVWGGGIYEHDAFYDLCDELGLMVWQDFMFACTLYPSDKAFLDSVAIEATQQVRRLRNHACMTLWCGNNELPQINKVDLRDPKTRAGYEKLFHKCLPDVLAKESPEANYWPSSEWRGFFDSTHEDGEKCGDTHYWEVWHRRQPVTDYERWHFRFCSEFGMQSYSSIPTQDTFCPRDQANIFGPIMENHQKNRAGNQIISDYISRRYRFPKDQEGLIYLSQLNQAFCMRFAIEHFRRITPRCMGAIYWQLNDCWPVASWSSIEFTGRWKALHYAARRFFAPALLSAHILEDETNIIGNYRKAGDGRVDLYTVYDAPAARTATVNWELRRLHPQTADEAIVESGSKPVRLVYGQSRRQVRLNVKKHMESLGADELYLRIFLTDGEDCLSEQTVFLAPPRFLELQKPKTTIALTAAGENTFIAEINSDVFQHGTTIDVEGIIAHFSDNGFDLYPMINKRIVITLPEALSQAQLEKRLKTYSLVDAYC